MIFDIRARTIQDRLRVKHITSMRAMYFNAFTDEFIVIYMIIPLSIVKYRNKILKKSDSHQKENYMLIPLI